MRQGCMKHCILEKPVPAEFAAQRKAFDEKHKVFENDSRKVLELLKDESVRSSLRQDKQQNLAYLKEHQSVSIDNINAVYYYGKGEFEQGNYAAAADILYHFKILSVDNEMIMWATWGKFAAEILSYNWSEALEDLKTLRETIDQRIFIDPYLQLHHRTWLIHWSLYPFFNHEHGREALIELFLSPPYINSIQQSCPWILRYLIAATVTSTNRKAGSKRIPAELERASKANKTRESSV